MVALCSTVLGPAPSSERSLVLLETSPSSEFPDTGGLAVSLPHPPKGTWMDGRMEGGRHRSGLLLLQKGLIGKQDRIPRALVKASQQVTNV